MARGADRLGLCDLGPGERSLQEKPVSFARRSDMAGVPASHRQASSLDTNESSGGRLVQRRSEDHVPDCDLCAVSAGDLDGPGDVSCIYCRSSVGRQRAWRAAVRADDSLLCLEPPPGFPAGPRYDGDCCRIQKPHASDDHRANCDRQGGLMTNFSRRKLITGGLAATAGVSGLAAAALVAERYGLIPPDSGGVWGPGETLTYAAQRLLTTHSAAREFPRSMISKMPFANETAPPNDAFKHHQANGFSDWRLTVDGMVARPASLSLSDLRSLPVRSQITEVACEEGWSYIAEWIGTPLVEVLHATGLLPQARYLVYFSIEPGWWESIDLADALHPQTLLTLGMNDGELPVSFGGPLRLRVPRQLGYKSVKYITRITATDSMKHFGQGLGSASPEGGYAWYAGI